MEEIYCSKCEEYHSVFGLFEYCGIYEIPNTVRGFESSVEECPNCGSEIELSSYVIMEEAEFVETISIQIAKMISEEICECQHCNDDIIVVAQKYGDPSDLSMVYELVEGYELPSNIIENVYRNICCSGCGSDLESDQPYVTSYEVERWYRNEVDIVVNTFGFTESEGNEFINYLLENPMLGLNHPIGQKIFKKIHSKDIPGIKTVESGERLFRGRKRNNLERIATYIPDELWNPPEGIPGQGRYNPPGISSLYLASNAEVIISELKPQKNEETIDIAEFLILNDMLIWDVRGLDIDIFSAIPSFNKITLNQEYVFPNFIAQCLMANQYKGILYNSTCGDGDNYCLFNFKRIKDLVITEVNPYHVKKRPEVDLTSIF
ncbi:RES family NAD+ phosphorylase [Viridibacillus arvi]|uniref:RES family NAD+ phosphorylase n=1 Tax=Viridibacillus arvi TaxID=263475 RepID=UPI0034CE4577